MLTDQYFGQARPLGWARALFKIGAVVSLRELVYLHYVLDLWADWRRKPHALCDVVIVRLLAALRDGTKRERVSARHGLDPGTGYIARPQPLACLH